jgi:AcrR family transcriptional regulator
MPLPARPNPRRAAARRRPDRYHHGDLAPALVSETLRLIQSRGVEAVTLRKVGQRLGVSRTALYRHFTGKPALLAAVSGEGFRTLRERLEEAWRFKGGGHEGLAAMGVAYVHFAITNPSHYRVMFGGFVPHPLPSPGLAKEAAGAFQVLVDAIVSLQQAGEVRPDDPLQLARFIWSMMHGIAMLTIDGRLRHQGSDPDELARFAVERVRSGIGADAR